MQKWFYTYAEIIDDWFDMRPQNFNQRHLYMVWYGHVSTWWSFCISHWFMDKKCPRCLIIWLRWARKHQWTLINCICFTTSLFFNFDTLLNSSLSLLSFPTNKGVITWFSFAITWIDNVIMHQQEDKCNSLRNNIAHSGNHCGVIVSQSITVIERCDPNHWSPQKINVLTEAENIAVQSKTSGP